MIIVHAELGCEKCGQRLVLKQDHLPTGWWKDDQGREICPRHKPRIECDEKTPADVHTLAIEEHLKLGNSL